MLSWKRSSHMDNSIVITINDQVIVDCDGTDPKAIATTLRLFAETIERWGIKHAARVLPKSKVLQEVLFVEAECGDAYLSTVIG